VSRFAPQLETLPRPPFVPLAAGPAEEGLYRKIVWVFVILGVMIRIISFALNFPLWGDEAFVAANFISRGYLDLLRPLDYSQICPLLFLWLELSAVKLLGFHEYSLRLVPTLASVASVFLFAHMAGRVTRGWAWVLAVGVFATAYYPIRHGAEVKPYATDLLMALILFSLAIEWWRRPERVRWLWALAAVVPWALASSHPAVFVAGGISLGLARAVWVERRRALLPFLVYNVALVLTFLALFAAFTGVQQGAALQTLRTNYWAGAFPPWHRPLELLLWLVEAHTGRMFAYPFGGPWGMSTFTTVCFLCALNYLRRHRERTLIGLALGPFVLAFVASLLGRYPYGGSARTMIFVAPAVCLFMGLGLAAIIARIPRPQSHHRAPRIAVVLLLAAALVMLAGTIAQPYKTEADKNSRDFARWFWPSREGVACAKSDLGRGFNARNWSLFRSSLYLCNQKIYSPRHRDGIAFDPTAPALDRPWRCVLYNEWPENDPACAAWVASLHDRFEVADSETFTINPQTFHDDGTDVGDRYTVLTFVPRARESASIARETDDKTSR
jgi:hypothetical protein